LESEGFEMGLLWIGFKILEKKDSAKQGVSGLFQIWNSAVPLFKLTGLAKSNFTFQVGCPGCSEGHPGWVIKRICNPPTHGSRPKHHFQRPHFDPQKIAAAAYQILGCLRCSSEHQSS
jgi:hypothetical protein